MTEERRIENQARLNRIARLVAEYEAVTGEPLEFHELDELVQAHHRDLLDESSVFAEPVSFVWDGTRSGGGR